jgi:lactoylglutathione lyase
MHTRSIEEQYFEPPEDTAGYVFNHTMLRIKNPEVSVAFYRDIMGMQLVKRIPFEAFSFTLYFLGYLPSADAFPKDAQQRFAHAFGVSGMLELTHNWGTETQEGPVYHDGNAQPQGFGHIGFAVPNVNAACDRFERLGVEFIKRPDDGKMKGIAFIKDPDGYWIEIFSAENIADVIGSVSIR